MLGFHRKERNRNLMAALCLSYDDKTYVALAKRYAVHPVSLEQAVENVTDTQLLDKDALEKFGDASMAIKELNEDLLKKVQPQLDLLELIASGKQDISEITTRRLSVSVETELEEYPFLPMVNTMSPTELSMSLTPISNIFADNKVYYKPKHHLSVCGNGGRYKIN